MTLRTWKFFDPVYMAQFFLYRGPYSLFTQRMKRLYDLDDDGRPAPAGKCLEHTHDNGTRHYVMWVPGTFNLRASDCLNTLAHEAMHLTIYVLMTRGIDATKDNHEQYCYYHGWLFEQCWKRLKA